MKILFSMRHLGFLRNFHAAIVAAAKRQHAILVVYEGPGKFGEEKLASRIHGEYPNVQFRLLQKAVADHPWHAGVYVLRLWLDYLRYLSPMYARDSLLRERVERHTPCFFPQVMRLPLLRSTLGRRIAARTIGVLESSLPPHPDIGTLVADEKPDLVVVTPLLWFGSDQVDYVRVSRRQGIPSVLAVGSWDHLTSKGTLYDHPDWTNVWNEAQKQEAIAHHAVPEPSITVTGAHTYDHWFTWSARSRDEFCHAIGIAKERPILLYVGSSKFIAPREVEFVERWVDAIRGCGDAVIRDAGIILRPHPQNARIWAKADFSRYRDVLVFPRGGANPIEESDRQDYYDSLYHCVAVIGINTSAQIEAAIVGRPVFTVKDPMFRRTQTGTLHYHHLSPDQGGFLFEADSLDDHLAQLCRHGLGQDVEDANRSFLESFVRPHGLNKPGAEVFADQLDTVAARPPRVPSSSSSSSSSPMWRTLALRAAWWPCARLADCIHSRRSRTNRRSADKIVTEKHRIDRDITEFVRSKKRQDLDPKLRAIASGDNPIVFGPWLGEVGFEVLYWIPFLHWVVETYNIDPDRVHIVSRGGVKPWYRGIGGHYHEIFEVLTVPEFREFCDEIVRAQHGNYSKQMEESESERRLLERFQLYSAESRSISRLHPALMFDVIWPFIREQAPRRYLHNFMRFRPFEPDRASVPERLPRDYIAVKFYFSNAFPETEDNIAFVRDCLRSLSARRPVVLLGTGLTVDDHKEWSAGSGDRVISLEEYITAANNLAVQSAVIANASAFVGTYGGMSYIPGFHHTPTVTFYSHPRKFVRSHLELAASIFHEFQVAPYLALHTRDAALLASLGLVEAKLPAMESP